MTFECFFRTLEAVYRVSFINPRRLSSETKMADIFCCSSVRSYKNCPTDHEEKFRRFLAGESSAAGGQHVFQVVQKIDFSPTIVSTKYYDESLREVSAADVANGRYQKINSFKNFKCLTHKYFYEMNMYVQGTARSTHHQSTLHGRAYARDASIDLPGSRGVDKGPHW